MPTDIKDRGPKMQTKTKTTRLNRDWPEVETIPRTETEEAPAALARKDRGTKMQTKTKPVRRNREYPWKQAQAATSRTTSRQARGVKIDKDVAKKRA
ncbi:hypothetical protein HUU05_02290 [candidate division KSB1 bacterium]|nr:hypothetical protein [candidate division KSB1 bacterium]